MRKIKVTFIDVKVKDPNHVGQEKDWCFGLVVNGETLLMSVPKTLCFERNVSIKAKAYEKDKVSDKGISEKQFDINEIINSTVSVEVKVEENRGRYTGNIAIVTFQVQFEA